MLDKFLVLLERFVVAHELIAANSAKQTATLTAANNATKPVEIKVEGEDVIDTKPVKGGNKQEPEDDLADDDEPEEKPKRKPRQTKQKEEPKGPDVAKLREEIKTIAKAIAAGDSDECADKFDELLEDYKVRTVTKLADEDVEAFHKDATKLVGKYYEIEE
ncbi:hypothetical protein G3156_004479 [Salmonella enterica subsp. enterica serovar Montevideo]|nr:hypothetical protein [Salmonella enterica subsp. enterica serovar Montevideo]